MMSDNHNAKLCSPTAQQRILPTAPKDGSLKQTVSATRKLSAPKNAETDNDSIHFSTPSKQHRPRAISLRTIITRTNRSKRTMCMWLSRILLVLFSLQKLLTDRHVLISVSRDKLSSFAQISSSGDYKSNSPNDSTINKSIPIRRKDSNQRTLALLYPPGLLGGYRNQAIRFIAFTTYAKMHNISQMLLNSILWSTQLGSGIGGGYAFVPIPFDWIFDVEYWNTFAPKHLPFLVRDDQLQLDQNTEESCWTKATEMDSYGQLSHATKIDYLSHNNTHYYIYTPSQKSDPVDPILNNINHLQRASLLQGVLTPIANITVPFITNHTYFNPRKEDFLRYVQHCQKPFVYGGGTMAGRLWNDYMKYHRGIDKPNRNTSSVPYDTDVWVYRALRPAPLWRNLAEVCVQQHASNGRYIALHARIELEIMGHPCGRNMERNLTAILERVYALRNARVMDGKQLLVSALVIAVSRAGMEEVGTNAYVKNQNIADENLRTLNLLTRRQSADANFLRNASELSPFLSQFQRALPVFECGERMLKEYYNTHPEFPDHGALLQAVLNFHIAVFADVFVGVKGSSYSTDILTTRYWLGKRDANYIYTKSGIEQVLNLPEPHKKCGSSKL